MVISDLAKVLFERYGQKRDCYPDVREHWEREAGAVAYYCGLQTEQALREPSSEPLTCRDCGEKFHYGGKGYATEATDVPGDGKRRYYFVCEECWNA